LVDIGVHVPADMSVAEFDDHSLAKIWNPSLTTVRQDFNKVGKDSLISCSSRLIMRGLTVVEQVIGINT
jgi:DNA-binding LacI/PurR family transcriptional regulator